MIIVRIIGGLGNQMFQYAMAKSLASLNKGNVKLDLRYIKKYETHPFLLDKLNVKYEEVTSKELKIFNSSRLNIIKRILVKKRYMKEKSLTFDSKILEIKGKKYLAGYFQCEKYFKNIRNDLLKDFSIQNMDNQNYSIAEKARSRNSVSLHVRRGDYFSNSVALQTHGLCSLDYFSRAVEHIADRVEEPEFFVFSDDPEWAIKNIRLDFAVNYIDINGKENGHKDMYLMRNCKHNIIANSSFSWWGAWLNKNNDKIVIAPMNWFVDKKRQNQSADIVPSSWLRL
jgi:hypothetical protein